MTNKRNFYLDDNLAVQAGANKRRTYTVYGYGPDMTRETLSGFNGQLLDLVTRGYHLGQGRRFYSPALGRFCSPDPLSPSGRGGINGYAYCGGDPVNFIDLSGLNRRWYKPSPPAYSPRRLSEQSKREFGRKALTRSNSLPNSWNDPETLPTFREASEAARYLDKSQLDVVRYAQETQRNKVLPTYAQATNPKGLAKYRFNDDFSETRHLQSAQIIDSDAGQSRLDNMLRLVTLVKKSTLVSFLVATGSVAIIIVGTYFASEAIRKWSE
ncbi:RHS repeat-associated core domain-containing protein [Pseudomonas laurentiana]